MEDSDFRALKCRSGLSRVPGNFRGMRSVVLVDTDVDGGSNPVDSNHPSRIRLELISK